jgi:hypothetical protein
VRVPQACYQIEQTLTERFPALRAAQIGGLAVWVHGTIAAGSACQSAVVAAWLAEDVKEPAIRQYLREVLYDGADRAAPCTVHLDVTGCFAPLLAWVLDWWPDRAALPLAVDATNLRHDVTAVVVSVLYQGSAMPVAWRIFSQQPKAAGQAKDRWMDTILALLGRLRAVVPPPRRVLVLADRGLWSPRLRKQIRTLGWQPLLRLQSATLVQPAGERGFRPACSLAPEPGTAWVGRATIFKQRQTQVQATLLVVWDLGQQQVWVLLTDLRPRQVGVVWYALRMWIELGLRVLKGLGWQWQRTRRTDPDRVARHWLVLAVATLWTLATGTRVEDAERLGRGPAHLHRPPPAADPPPPQAPRRYALFVRGSMALRRQLAHGRLWTRLWLRPGPWPEPQPHLRITYHQPAHTHAVTIPCEEKLSA